MTRPDDTDQLPRMISSRFKTFMLKYVPENEMDPIVKKLLPQEILPSSAVQFASSSPMETTEHGRLTRKTTSAISNMLHTLPTMTHSPATAVLSSPFSPDTPKSKLTEC